MTSKTKAIDAEYVCANCKHYCQHYLSMPEFRKLFWVNCGHCILPRLKHREPNSKACKHFEIRQNVHEKRQG